MGDRPRAAQAVPRPAAGRAERREEALRAELVAEAGSPVAVTHVAQLEWPLADGLRAPLELIDSFAWERELPDTNLFGPSHRVVWKEPVGAVAAVVPWNFPFEVTINKLGPAPATGNTVVLKPTPDTPWNATRIGRIVAERTDMPAGVVNVVPTSDNAVAELLVRDPRVDMVSFTGSTALRRPVGPAEHRRPADQRPAAGPRARLHRAGPQGGSPRRRRPGDGPPTCLRATSSSRHCWPMWTTT
nr:aldehyde dehydrogenase family protein [Pseudonocardia sp. KRD291]